MWWAFLQAVQNALAAWPDLADVTVELGTVGAVPEEDTIQLDRGPESADDLMQPRQGELTMWLDCWATRDTDAVALGRLQAIEAAALDALRDLQLHGDRINGADYIVRLRRRESDGGIFRPTRGSRTYLNIEWRTTT